MVKRVRRERQLETCMGCLALLCREQQNWPLLHAGNILRVATDILGPPPPGYCLWEYQKYQLWDPENRTMPPPKIHPGAASLPTHGRSSATVSVNSESACDTGSRILSAAQEIPLYMLPCTGKMYHLAMAGETLWHVWTEGIVMCRVSWGFCSCSAIYIQYVLCDKGARSRVPAAVPVE